MCGISGYSFKNNTLPNGRLAILANSLARLNDMRGGDSWGVCGINGTDFNITRGMGKLAEHAYHVADFRSLILHTRFATSGKKCVENAHPFEIGEIIGAHNGCIHNHKELLSKYNRDFDVDSMHLFAHLNEGRDFGDVEGYGAIEWIRRNDPTRINLCRVSSGGELSIFGIGDRNAEQTEGVVWSSSEKHLMESLFCAGIKTFFPYRVDEGVVYYIRDGEVYLSSMNKLEFGKGRTTSYTASSYQNIYETGDDDQYEDWKKSRWGTGGAGEEKKDEPQQTTNNIQTGAGDSTELVHSEQCLCTKCGEARAAKAQSLFANGGADKDEPFPETELGYGG